MRTNNQHSREAHTLTIALNAQKYRANKTITNDPFPQKKTRRAGIFSRFYASDVELVQIGERKKENFRANWKNAENNAEFNPLDAVECFELNFNRNDSVSREFQSNNFRHYFQVTRFAEQFTDNDLAINTHSNDFEF